MPPRSRSDVSFARAFLPYPIFAADFDPYNRGYLVVGGGGGEGRSGVPNGISVLDVSNRGTITTAVDIELSSNEDSVQSVGSLATKDGLIVFAGINSSGAEQEAGKNDHLRTFSIKYPPRKKHRTQDSSEAEDKGEWKLLDKRSLFKPSTASKKETYQRILRLSPGQPRESGSKRIGAIATGLAKESQIIVFNATNLAPEPSDVLARIDLPEDAEAADLDIAQSEDSEFSVAYCTDFDIYEQTYKYDFKKKRTERRPNGPRRVHQTPFPDTLENPASRPKFRCLRFLNSQNVIVLCNKANKSGAELRVFHLYPTGPAIMVQSKKLPSHIKQAIGMDVCQLGADETGNQQIAVAVAGQDISIEVFTINYQRQTDTFSKFRTYLTIRDAHKHQMTKICFSPFHPPAPEPTKTDKKDEDKTIASRQQPVPQYIRLASVSYGETAVVDTFPLMPLDPEKKDSRYVLSHPSDEAFVKWTYIFITAITILVVTFLFQSFSMGFEDGVGPFRFLPKGVREFLDQPAGVRYGQKGKWVTISEDGDDALPTNFPGKSRLRSLLSTHHSSPEDRHRKALVIRSSPSEDDSGGDLKIDVHLDKAAYRQTDSEAKHWDELSEHQKARWKERLVRAGEWVESEGETVLLGCLFSEFAGIIGQGAGDVLREL